MNYESAIGSTSFTHWGDNAELLHHAEIIHACPKLRDLSVRNTEHLDPLDHDAFSCGRNPHEIAFVCAVRSPDLYHLVSFGDKLVSRDVQVWESGEVSLTESFILLAIQVPISKVDDEVGGEIVFESSNVMFIPVILSVDLDEILVLFYVLVLLSI